MHKPAPLSHCNSPKVVDENSRTPLIVAAQKNRGGAAAYLLRAKANPSTRGMGKDCTSYDTAEGWARAMRHNSVLSEFSLYRAEKQSFVRPVSREISRLIVNFESL